MSTQRNGIPIQKDKIPENAIIKDLRPYTEFRVKTLSNYKKTDVKNALIDCMLREKVEPACNWGAEFICSGHFGELWETILFFFSKYIHLGNPKIPIYLKRRYATFKGIINSGDFFNELDLRNNETIRQLFAEIICVLTTSKKKNSFEYVKIDREEEFDMTKNTERFKAPSLEYADRVMKPEDPRELSVAINEFLYNLSINNNQNSCYWVDWIIEFDIICRNRKEPSYCEKRDDLLVENKFKRDIVWLIWDSILHQSEPLCVFIKESIQALFELFCIKYTNASGKKRRYMIYFAISLLTESFDATTELIEKKEMIDVVRLKINEIYKQIKKNEITSGEYASIEMSDKEKNFNDSLEKLNLINSI